MDKTLLGVTTPGQRGLGNDGNEDVIRIPESSSVTETSPSDCLMSYLVHSLAESYPSAEMQSVYSTAPAIFSSPSLMYGFFFPKLRALIPAAKSYHSPSLVPFFPKLRAQSAVRQTRLFRLGAATG